MSPRVLVMSPANAALVQRVYQDTIARTGPRGRRRAPSRASGLRPAPPSDATYRRALLAWDTATTERLLRALDAAGLGDRNDAAADGAVGDVVTERDAARLARALEKIAAGLRLGLTDPLALLDVVAARVEKHAAGAWRAQLAELGVTLDDADVPGLAALRKRWRAHNTDLVRALAKDKVAKVREVLEASPGVRVESLRKRIQEATGTSRSHAELLARDQTLKLNAQLTQARHEAAGVTEYVWRTSRDERVRKRHKELDGTRQRYAAPPVVDPRTGRRAAPGEDYQCRCTADPLLPEIDD